MTSLVKRVEKKITANSALRGFLVLLPEDLDSGEKNLKKLAKENGIERIPLTIFEGVGGPPRYNLSKDAQVTVHLWIRGRIVANYAFGKGEFDKKAVEKIVKQIPSVFEK